MFGSTTKISSPSSDSLELGRLPRIEESSNIHMIQTQRKWYSIPMFVRGDISRMSRLKEDQEPSALVLRSIGCDSRVLWRCHGTLRPRLSRGSCVSTTTQPAKFFLHLLDSLLLPLLLLRGGLELLSQSHHLLLMLLQLAEVLSDLLVRLLSMFLVTSGNFFLLVALLFQSFGPLLVPLELLLHLLVLVCQVLRPVGLLLRLEDAGAMLRLKLINLQLEFCMVQLELTMLALGFVQRALLLRSLLEQLNNLLL
mmetsp:Transcript_22168/g.52191  ORF Transcript_22168/g.52191 Transcript_22168/m.52191 type:complete len:253 (-) Transcript_22168:1285-2043(-)